MMKTLIDKASHSKIWIGYVVIFILLCFLCYLFPYTGSDWAWGSQIGIDRLNVWFKDYNARYFGDLVVLALTRSNILKAVTMSLCLTGIIFFINKLTGEHKNGAFIISAILVFMPVRILRQGVVWTSGFTSYTMPISLTLIYIYYVNNIYGENKPKYSLPAIFPLVALGVANTLIVEHLTIYNVVLSIYVIVFTYIKFKEFYIQHIAYFSGTITGALLMFSNPIYRSVADGTDSYRSIAGLSGIIEQASKAYFNTISSEGFFNNHVLNAFLVGTSVVIWLSIKDKISEKLKKLGTVSIGVMVAYAAGTVIVEEGNITALKALKYAEGVATAAYIIVFFVFLCVLPFDINRKVKLFFIFCSVGCLVAPLLVVTPIGSRCFFPAYVMMLYLGVEFYSLFEDDIKQKFEKAARVTGVTALCGFLFLFYIYTTNSICNNARIEKAQADAQNGETTIQVENLPYSRYVWYADMPNKTAKERFKIFYNIDESVKIKLVPSTKK